MKMANKNEILDELSAVKFRGGNIITAGLLSGLVIKSDVVSITLESEGIARDEMQALESAIKDKLSKRWGGTSVNVIFTANRQGANPQRKAAQWNREEIKGIKKIIAVASGKGGVGKSTITLYLAQALQSMNLKVGVLDADIYGPSMPHLLNISGKPEAVGEKMIPLIASTGKQNYKYPIKCISMGMLAEEGQPIIWRGPMVTKTIAQFLRGTNWGELDFLLVDMPPGTGDVQLSLAQQIPLSGVVMVTIPGQLAMLDVRRAAAMFRMLEVPILAVVENMSHYDDVAGGRHYIFGQGGGEQIAKEFGCKNLIHVPINGVLAAEQVQFLHTPL